MKLSAPIHTLKHRARQLARTEKTPLHEALDRVARQEGFARWSLLTAKYVESFAPASFGRLIEPGDLVLLGARPGQGKTLLCLRWVADALESGACCAVYSFEIGHGELDRRFRDMGVDLSAFGHRFHFDNSDGICAERICEQMALAERGTLIVVDYLQLLDQRRVNPPVQAQVTRLAAFARERGLKIVLSSQLAKSFEDATRHFPSLDDVRLPNPLDLSLFTRTLLLHEGRVVSA